MRSVSQPQRHKSGYRRSFKGEHARAGEGRFAFAQASGLLDHGQELREQLRPGGG